MSLKNIARLGIMAMVFATVLPSCSKDNKDPYPNKGDNGETESGITEGFTASVTYCGDYYNTGFHDYVIVLQAGEIDNDNMFVNGGIELSLDVLTAQGGATYFPSGTYTLLPKDTKFNAAGIVPSIKETDDDGNVSYGFTYLYTEKDAKNYWLEPIDDTRLEVSSSGSEYTIKVGFTVGTEKYSYEYTGNLAFYAMEDNGGDNGDSDDITGDIEFVASSVEAYNYGDAFGNGADDFLLYLDQGDETEYISIEFTHPSSGDRTTLPTGEWSIPSNFFDVEEIDTDILLPYFYFEGYEDYTYGTTYCYNSNLIYGATSGTLKITKSGDNYSIALKFSDSYSDNAEVTCKYTGSVTVDDSEYYDGTETSALSVKKSHSNKVALKTVKRNNAHACEKADKSTRSAVRTK